MLFGVFAVVESSKRTYVAPLKPKMSSWQGGGFGELGKNYLTRGGALNFAATTAQPSSYYNTPGGGGGGGGNLPPRKQQLKPIVAQGAAQQQDALESLLPAYLLKSKTGVNPAALVDASAATGKQDVAGSRVGRLDALKNTRGGVLPEVTGEDVGFAALKSPHKMTQQQQQQQQQQQRLAAAVGDIREQLQRENSKLRFLKDSEIELPPLTREGLCLAAFLFMEMESKRIRKS